MLTRLRTPIAGLALLLAASLSAQPALPAPSPKLKVPRTPDGHPDFQGTWTNVSLTMMQRAEEFGGKATLTDAEALTYESKDHRVYEERPEIPPAALLEGKAVGADQSEIWEGGSTLARVNGKKRTSLVIDPPDGRVPELTPDGKRRAALAGQNRQRADSAKDLPLKDRCLAVTPVPMIPQIYNSNYQIVQTPDYVMILGEMIHDARIIKMNSTHAAASVRLWLGDSIGHWEGDTLVVDTTNFNSQIAFRGSTENVHVIERLSFDSVDVRTLVYRATIEDPATFTKPWTVEYSFVPTGDRIFEYSCHEGNSWINSRLSAARQAEAK